jgi:hypothetical protein
MVMSALTGQCRRCSRFGELIPTRGVYYCRTCGEAFENHLRGYDGPERRRGKPGAEGLRRRWSDLPASVLDTLALAGRSMR